CAHLQLAPGSRLHHFRAELARPLHAVIITSPMSDEWHTRRISVSSWIRLEIGSNGNPCHAARPGRSATTVVITTPAAEKRTKVPGGGRDPGARSEGVGEVGRDRVRGDLDMRNIKIFSGQGAYPIAGGSPPPPAFPRPAGRGWPRVSCGFQGL